MAVASPAPSSSAHSDAEPETGADAEEPASDSTLSPVSATLSPALRAARGFAPDSEVEAATASDSSTGPEWCVVKEGRGKATAAAAAGVAPESPPPQADDVPGAEGGDPPSTSPSDGGGTPGAAGEEDDDDIDEDWGEI